MNTNIGLSAFPHESLGGARSSGMTLRDYLAAKAMMVSIEGARCRAGFVEEESYPQLAEHAYKIADAMLEARRK